MRGAQPILAVVVVVVEWLAASALGTPLTGKGIEVSYYTLT